MITKITRFLAPPKGLKAVHFLNMRTCGLLNDGSGLYIYKLYCVGHDATESTKVSRKLRSNITKIRKESCGSFDRKSALGQHVRRVLHLSSRFRECVSEFQIMSYNPSNGPFFSYNLDIWPRFSLSPSTACKTRHSLALSIHDFSALLELSSRDRHRTVLGRNLSFLINPSYYSTSTVHVGS